MHHGRKMYQGQGQGDIIVRACCGVCANHIVAVLSCSNTKVGALSEAGVLPSVCLMPLAQQTVRFRAMVNAERY